MVLSAEVLIAKPPSPAAATIGPTIAARSAELAAAPAAPHARWNGFGSGRRLSAAGATTPGSIGASSCEALKLFFLLFTFDLSFFAAFFFAALFAVINTTIIISVFVRETRWGRWCRRFACRGWCWGCCGPSR